MIKQKGFTIVELTVSVAIILIVLVASASFAKDVLFLNRAATQGLVAQSDSRRALKFMMAELRTATPSATGAYTIESASTSSLVFFADLDGDNRSERVRYYLDLQDRTIKRGIVVPTGSPPSYVLNQETYSSVATDILGTSTPVFEYFDTNYAGTSSPMTYPLDLSLIRLVRVNLIIDKDPNSYPGPQITSSEVTLRNLKDNL